MSYIDFKMWIMVVCTNVCSNPFSFRTHLTDAFFCIQKNQESHTLTYTERWHLRVSTVGKFRLWNCVQKIETGIERIQYYCCNGIQNYLNFAYCVIEFGQNYKTLLPTVHLIKFNNKRFLIQLPSSGLMLSAVFFVTCSW
jgi:hypothetical protein